MLGYIHINESLSPHVPRPRFEARCGSTHWPHLLCKTRPPPKSMFPSPRDFDGAPEVVRRLVCGGELPSPPMPSPEAMAAMARCNELEAEGDFAGAQAALEQAKQLGHSLLAEHGGWK